MAIIVTSVLPSGVDHVAHVNGVWVCDFASAMTLAFALRLHIEAMAQARVVAGNRSEVADNVYESSAVPSSHITSPTSSIARAPRRRIL